ncbi:MAG: hypothetical protein IPH35_18355 [Rhodoferax sp.]|nr:hypothetical protein [Rhodoferax sp.]
MRSSAARKTLMSEKMEACDARPSSLRTTLIDTDWGKEFRRFALANNFPLPGRATHQRITHLRESLRYARLSATKSGVLSSASAAL